MIIVISSEGASMDSKLDLRFGRCQYFTVLDTDTKVYEFKENTAKDSNHGAGIAAAQLAVDYKAEVVITGSLGPKAMAVIEGAGIRAYESGQISIKESIRLFEENKLSKIRTTGKSHK